MSFHAIVIGTGVDALVAAHLLARRGKQVLLVEERSPAIRDFGWVPSQIVAELGLALEVEAPDPWAVALLPDGAKLELWRDIGRSSQSIRHYSERDAQKWPGFCRRMAALARLFEQLYLEAPTDPLNLRFALGVRGLGREGMVDLMRLLPMPVTELLDDWFECDALKGALAAMGILNIQQGPRSGGTAFRFLHHHVGSPEGVFRPPRTELSTRLRQLARLGLYFKAAETKKILTKAGRARGVLLGDGEEIEAPIVVSGADPRRTLLELADPGWLDPELARAVGNIRARGVAARLLFEGPANGNLVFAPSLDYLERAYDEIKYGRVSREPYLEAHSSPRGLEVHFQYVPQGAKEDFGDLAATARRLLPGLENAKLVSILGPADLERDEGWPQGQPYHAELALDQALWMRPLPELSQYKTPIEGLWLCGPAMHPGGGVAGAAGYNCSQAILKEKI
ncbi:MAG TPA: NAD(P)/FAD-dependent oxidoreductase [Burkholderiales bacterium]|nr:NAD(P)/FAD-dependent oxidoreductase [Burkholderiales bacterium]